MATNKTTMIKVQDSSASHLTNKQIVLGRIDGPLRGFRLYVERQLTDEQIESLLNEVAERAYEEGKKDGSTT